MRKGNFRPPKSAPNHGAEKGRDSDERAPHQRDVGGALRRKRLIIKTTFRFDYPRTQTQGKRLIKEIDRVSQKNVDFRTTFF